VLNRKQKKQVIQNIDVESVSQKEQLSWTFYNTAVAYVFLTDHRW